MTSISVQSYLSTLTGYSKSVYGTLSATFEDLAGPFYSFLESQYNLVKTGKQLQDVDGNIRGKSYSIKTQAQERYVKPFLYAEPHYTFYTSGETQSRERQEITLFTRNIKGFVEETDSALTIIAGFVSKAGQDAEAARRKIQVVERWSNEIANKKEPTASDAKFLAMCQGYMNIYRNVLVWVSRLSDPCDEIEELITNGHKYITKYN